MPKDLKKVDFDYCCYFCRCNKTGRTENCEECLCHFATESGEPPFFEEVDLDELDC